MMEKTGLGFSLRRQIYCTFHVIVEGHKTNSLLASKTSSPGPVTSSIHFCTIAINHNW